MDLGSINYEVADIGTPNDTNGGNGDHIWSWLPFPPPLIPCLLLSSCRLTKIRYLCLYFLLVLTFSVNCFLLLRKTTMTKPPWQSHDGPVPLRAKWEWEIMKMKSNWSGRRLSGHCNDDKEGNKCTPFPMCDHILLFQCTEAVQSVQLQGVGVPLGQKE